MSFFRIYIISYYKHIKIQAHLRAKILKLRVLQFFLSNKIIEKRISLFFSLKCKASMAVEAALAIPLFLFFMINILFAFDMLRLHGNLMGAMHQTGNKMAFYGYAYKYVEETGIVPPDDISSVLMSVGYAKNRVVHILGSDYLNHTCIKGGIAGLQFLKSSVMEEEDVIHLVASYKVKPFISTMGFQTFAMESRYYGRAWTGYDVEWRQSEMDNKDPTVFVTDTGVVYHVARNCTYLSPSVEIISAAMKQEARNENGEKYYVCERCDENSLQAVLYITSQGNRYHSSLQCSGLKRTIYTIHLSEVGGKGRCSKCG